MLETYILVLATEGLHIYDPQGNPAGARQLWLYSNFQLPGSMPASLLLAVLPFLEPEEPQSVKGFNVSQVQNCFRVSSNVKSLFGYIIGLQDQVDALESNIGIYPPTGATVSSPGVYRVGGVHFTKKGKWVHISRNRHLIELSASGELKKVDLPSTVKSISSAGEWKQRVSKYILEHK